MPDNSPSLMDPTLEVPGYCIPKGSELITDLSVLVEKIRALINSSTGSVLIAFEGGPGAGKSHVASKVAEVLQSDVRLILHEMDGYLGTERASMQRKEVFKSPYDFWQGYCRDRQAAIDLNKMMLMEPDTVLRLEKWYSRENGGKFITKEVPLPSADRKIILFPGSGAGQIIRATEAAQKIVVFVYTPLIVAARAKARRALERGEEDARSEDYMHELKMVVGTRCVPAMTQKAIYFDNTEGIIRGSESY